MSLSETMTLVLKQNTLKIFVKNIENKNLSESYNIIKKSIIYMLSFQLNHQQ